MIVARFAAIPYSAFPGPISGVLLLSGGYLVLVAYVISFVAIGYQLSKHGAASLAQAGAICAFAFIVLQYAFSAAILKLAYDISIPVDIDLLVLARVTMYAAVAFGLGAIGYFWNARFRKARHRPD